MVSGYVRRFIINFMIMFPALSLLVYVLPFSAHYFDYGLMLGLVAIPFVRFFTPYAYRSAVYPIAAIVFLLLMLITLLADYTPLLSGTAAVILALPMKLSTFVSVIIALSLIMVAEGLLSDRLQKTVALLILSMGGLLDQLAIVTSIINNNSSYLVAYEFVNGEELYSLYTLVVYGYQLVLPLANMKVHIDAFMVFAFVVSIIGILVALYLRGEGKSPETINRFGYPVFAGSIIGAVAFVLIREMSRFGVQLSVVSLSIVVTLFVVGWTSRRSRKLLES